MNYSINCIYNKQGHWCTNPLIKRSLLGIGPRMCNQKPFAPYSTCGHQVKHEKPSCKTPMPPCKPPRPANVGKGCAECGMPVKLGEYHPYAACLMFKGCQDAETVRANLDAVTTEWQKIGARAEKNNLRANTGPR